MAAQYISPPMIGQDKILEGLNPAQIEAVTHGEGPLLVLAGAGSGKTRVLTCRVAYLIAAGRAAPEQILAVTFTNKAAGEMKSRIERLTEIAQSRMQVSTFHSFAALLLRFYGERIGLPRDYTIYDEDDSLSVVKSCFTDLGIDGKVVSPAVVLNRISDAKSEMVDADEYAAKAFTELNKKTARVYERYQVRLRNSHAVDFDDLLFLAVRLLQNDAEIRSRVQNKYRCLLIDEYQDTNTAQYLLARIISDGHKNIFAVGDEDQSIYGWRGANIKNILNFEDDFPACRIIRLERNYRSTQTILKAASQVVSKNQLRKGKTLYSTGDLGEPLTLLITETDHDEAERIVERAEDQVRMNVPRKEIAVLYRTNAQSRTLEESLKRRRIPYKIVGGIRFYQRKEIKDLVAYMKLVDNPRDDASFLRIINYPKRGIGEATVRQLEQRAVERGVALLELIASDRELEAVPKGSSAKLNRFATLIAHLKEKSISTPLHEFMELLAKEAGIIRDLQSLEPVESASRLENIEELVSSAEEYAAVNPEARLSSFLQEISLYTDLDAYDRESDAVTLMTLHAAKGLEFESVFIAGLEEGLLPISRSLDDQAKLEEERRLFYVGMTRAKSKLTLSYAIHRARFGQRASLRSRFLDEIPDDIVRAERHTLFDGMRGINPSFTFSDAVDPDDPYAAIQVGSTVYHARWGEGSVLHRRGMGESTEFEVRFHFAGTKKLLAKYANLRLIR